jgi:N-acetylglucosamine kinase-like BadF-type ATPase
MESKRGRWEAVSYLCVDGGQTKTAVSLLDLEGKTIESWKEGSLTTPSKPGAKENLREVVGSTAEELSRRLVRLASTPPEAACFSLTGYLEEDDTVPSIVRGEMEKVVPEIKRVHTVPDYVGNWAAATRGKPGIMIISGGGSVVYGRNASGRSLRIGGWGHLLGDEGSGYWIGLEAIKVALRSWAGVTRKTELEEKLLERFGAVDDLQLLSAVYSGEISEAQIAGLVPLVVSLSDEGDEASDRIMEEAAQHLANYCSAALDRLGTMPVYPSGGVFKDQDMQKRFRSLLANAGYDVEMRPTSAEPSEGIFLIARGGILG